MIIPVRNSPKDLRGAIESLRCSTFRDFETIVVDDASTDDTREVARAAGCVPIRLARRSGPALARNRGALDARGDILVFIDADVHVHPDTLSKLVAEFDAYPDVDAVFGSYDTSPRAPNIASQYKNLFHHYMHQSARREASTFWSGCGAIRRLVFLEFDGFDSGYSRPAVEDIELGSRLRRAERNIRLAPHVQSTHVKRWTLCSLVKSDVLDRGVPWTRLILRDGAWCDDLNLKRPQLVCAALAFALATILIVAALIDPATAVLLVGGAALAWALDRWSDTSPKAAARLAAATLAGSFIFGLYRFGAPALLPMALGIGIVAANARFYSLLAHTRGVAFAIAAWPLHVLYYLYSGLSVALGSAIHVAARMATSRVSEREKSETLAAR